MKPITFSLPGTLPLAPEQVAGQLLDLANWPSFQGCGLLPGIRAAEFEALTPNVGVRHARPRAEHRRLQPRQGIEDFFGSPCFQPWDARADGEGGPALVLPAQLDRVAQALLAYLHGVVVMAKAANHPPHI